MATGYTYPVKDGEITSFREFAIKCAEAFGVGNNGHALITDTRDSYHRDKLAEAKKLKNKVLEYTAEEVAALRDAEYAQATKRYAEAVEVHAREMARYKFMLEKVKAWNPPMPKHQGIKEFMLEQLQDSMKFDDYLPQPPTFYTIEEWRDMEFNTVKHNLEYYAEKVEKEEQMATDNSKWVNAFFESLED